MQAFPNCFPWESVLLFSDTWPRVVSYVCTKGSEEFSASIIRVKDKCTLKMEAGGSSEKLVSTYQTTWRHIPGHSNFHSDRGQLCTLHRTVTTRAMHDTIIGLHKHNGNVGGFGRKRHVVTADTCRRVQSSTTQDQPLTP